MLIFCWILFVDCASALPLFPFFSNHHRESVKRENPDIPFGEVAKRISELWKKTSDSEKQKYIKLAEKDKQRYESEMAKYKPPADSDDDEDEKPSKKRSKKSKKSKKHETSSDESDSDSDDSDSD